MKKNYKKWERVNGRHARKENNIPASRDGGWEVEKPMGFCLCSPQGSKALNGACPH